MRTSCRWLRGGRRAIEAGLLDLEGHGAVHVRDVNHHEFGLPVHDAASLCQCSGVADRSLACVKPTLACFPVPSDGAARIGCPPIPLPQVAARAVVLRLSNSVVGGVGGNESPTA
jgi:hypothetical protein